MLILGIIIGVIVTFLTIAGLNFWYLIKTKAFDTDI